MNRNIIILFYLLQCWQLLGQTKGDYNWQMGTISSSSTHNNPSSIEISFTNNERSITAFYRPMYMGYFNASISDTYGNLLLYSNGCKINDGSHATITGSEILNPGPIHDEWCGQYPGSYPIGEGGIFLPFFNDSLVLLLHQRLVVLGSPIRIFVDRLFYTSLIMEGNSYTIVEKSKPIIEDTLSSGRLEAILGITENYWWVIQGMRNSNKYFTIGLEGGEIDTIFLQAIGDTTVKQGETAAQSAFSPDGKKYARYSPADDLFLFDFDRTTGTLSNYQKFHVADSGLIGGLAFSPNSRFLYASATQDLYQFDLEAMNIQSSKTHIGHYDGFGAPFPTTFYYMQPGPDCKIYMIPPNGVEYMHVINNPDQKGVGCDFVQHGIELPSSITISIPNFPVFRVFPDAPCDPNISTFQFDIENPEDKHVVYPNPTKDFVNIKLDGQNSDGTAHVSIFNPSGTMLSKYRIEYSMNTIQLDLGNMDGGVYFIRVLLDKDSKLFKVFKQE